jgi:ribonuclease Z
MTVTLTGTKGGPAAVNGLAGVGTLVRYGDDGNECGAVNLQFDAGRATSVRLSQIPVPVGAINAIFFTHMHSDHTDGFADLMQLRWHYHYTAPKLDVVCADDAPSPMGFIISCRKFAEHIGDVFIQSGEIAQRHAERRGTPAGGPAALINLIAFAPSDDAKVVWASSDVKVSAVRSTHMPGHVSFRVDTPAGSVVISGDASNDKPAPPRPYSTSDQVEKLSKGADVLVHATTHPNMGPEKGGGMPAPIFYRQSIAPDIGAMAQRARVKIYMLTHLTPSIGEVDRIDNWKIAGAPLGEADFRKAVEEGGYTGTIIVGRDLTTVRLPVK